MTVDPQFALVRNLTDAGCDVQTTETILQLHATGKDTEALRLLRLHRKTLLSEVHDNQRKIDCLDFLTFKLEQEHTVPSSTEQIIKQSSAQNPMYPARYRSQ